MRLILPHGGYGLGNDLIPWAKAYILSRELGAVLLHPAWGNNSRKYYRYFRTSRYDYLAYRLLRRALPRYRFTEEDYQEIHIDDFAESAKAFMRRKGLANKRRYILEVTGFWGAFRGLESAKGYILSRLLNTAYTQENLYSLRKQLWHDRLTIGVHVRLGDFRQAGAFHYAGIEQASLPLDWYEYLCHRLEAALGKKNIQWVICSDGRPEELGTLVDRDNAILASQRPYSDISDLLALCDADLLVCSISSYSMWAAFLSHSPYIWYKSNLVEIPEGHVNRFIRSLGIQLENSASETTEGRGVALNVGDALPVCLLEYLETRYRLKQSRHDLVRGGAV